MSEIELKKIIEQMERRVVGFTEYMTINANNISQYHYWDGRRAEAAFTVEILTAILNNYGNN